MKGNELSLVKFIEYFDGEVWKPIIWYSNREDNEFESVYGKSKMIEHGEAFDMLCDQFKDIINKTEVMKRELPDDLSDFVKNKLKECPNVYSGASYYYVSELLELIDKEEELFEEEVKKGVEIKIYDAVKNFDEMIDKDLLKFEKVDLGDFSEYKFKVNRIDQLKKLAAIVSYLVYGIRGFVDDDKIRVVFYFV